MLLLFMVLFMLFMPLFMPLLWLHSTSCTPCSGRPGATTPHVLSPLAASRVATVANSCICPAHRGPDGPDDALFM